MSPAVTGGGGIINVCNYIRRKVSFFSFLSFFPSFLPSFFVSAPTSSPSLSRQTLTSAKKENSCKNVTAAFSKLDGEIMGKKINEFKLMY